MLLYVALATVIAAPTPEIQYKQPQVAANGQRAVVTFGAGNAIYVTASADGGRTFAKPVKVAEPGVISLGRHRGPRVALAADAIVVTAIAGATGRGVDGDVLAFRSADGGRTWSTGIRVNDAPGSAREGLHTMAANGRHVFAAWLDLRSKGTRLYGSVSRDGGLTWLKNALIYESPDGSVCECCHPSAAIDSRGQMYVMFRNSLAGSRDLYVAKSSDGGQSFAPAVKMGSGTWQLNACPMDGGGLAVDDGGKVVTAWRRGKEILTAADNRSEDKLGLGKDPAIALSAKGVYTAWSGEGGLQYKSPGQNATAVLDPDGAFVQLAPAAGGRVVAVWERKGAIVSDVLE